MVCCVKIRNTYLLMAGKAGRISCKFLLPKRVGARIGTGHLILAWLLSHCLIALCEFISDSLGLVGLTGRGVDGNQFFSGLAPNLVLLQVREGCFQIFAPIGLRADS